MTLTKFEIGTEFQTPPDVCKYMASLIPAGAKRVLEPTSGTGNLVRELNDYEVTAPENFFTLDPSRFDCIVMNPPFSMKYAFGVPEDLNLKGLRLGYYILQECMKMSDRIIALMPLFTISDSDVRLRYLKTFGLKSITILPRKTFKYVRIQTAVFELVKGWEKETLFKAYELIPKNLETYDRKYYLNRKIKAAGFKLDLDLTTKTIMVTPELCEHAEANKALQELCREYNYGVQYTAF
jgi:type I restriction-modification system DNA methylase subunit